MEQNRRRRVLIVEDDLELGRLIARHLKEEGFDAVTVRDGQSALSTFAGGSWTALVLDWMLPGMSGLELLQQVRSTDRSIPILMLTARGEEADKVLGLEMGCDDYMTKPFSLRELAARLRVLERRVELSRQLAAGDGETPLEMGEMVIDPGKRKVTIRGRPVQLTVKEFDLLLTMASHPGRTFSRSQLLDMVWGDHGDVYEHTVNSHINRLRGKIEDNPNRPRWIQTVWGVGYRFTDEY